LETDDPEKAKRVEIQLIALWNLTNDNYGYNMTEGGDGTLGLKCSEETKRKIGSSNTGKKHTEENKKKMSLSRKGRKLKPLTEEHKRKVGDAQRGKKLSDEHRKIISDSQKGRKLSDEHRKIISESQKGRKHSEEHIKKIIDARSKIRKIQDTITGEIFEGTYRQLAILLNLNSESFRTYIRIRGKYKQYILI
jgi:uncharacterized protein YeaC (DUF1315 family)